MIIPDSRTEQDPSFQAELLSTCFCYFFFEFQYFCITPFESEYEVVDLEEEIFQIKSDFD